MEILKVYLCIALFFFTLVCISHSDEIHDKQSKITSLEVVLLILFLSLLWPYVMVWRPLRLWWFDRGSKL